MKMIIIAAMLLSLMPITVEAQEAEINSRDLRGKVVHGLGTDTGSIMSRSTLLKVMTAHS